MKMYFHDQIQTYILFKSWVPTNNSEYIGSWFAIFFIAIFYESIITLRMYIEFIWLKNELKRDLDGKSIIYKSYYIQDFLKGLFKFLESTLSYGLMLITMTFNVGLFFAVITGLAIGTWIFAFIRRKFVIKSSDGTFNVIKDEAVDACCP
jgi:copper transporter 1